MSVLCTFLTLAVAALSLCALGVCNADKSQFNGFNYLGTSWGNQYSYSSSESQAIMRSMINQTNSNWIQLCFLWGQTNENSTDIYRLSSTPSDTDVANAVQYAQSLGFKVILRPGVNPQNGQWRGVIGKYWSADAPQWSAWFASYTAFMTHYASMAQELHTDMFAVGFEYAATVQQTAQWEGTIAAIRQLYAGPLRYDANWGNEGHVKYWGSLEYIGIDAYYPLDAANPNPSIADLDAAWKSYLPSLQAISQQYNQKPIIFAEIGYCSREQTNAQPWNCWAANTPLSQTAQSNCYQSFFETVYQQSYLKGVFFWDWSTNPNDSGPNNGGYSTNGKAASAVCKKYFS